MFTCGPNIAGSPREILKKTAFKIKIAKSLKIEKDTPKRL